MKPQAMRIRSRWAVILSITIVAVLAVLFLPSIPQNQNYRDFADNRQLLGIPNFWNVVSNLPFLIVATIGFGLLKKQWNQRLFTDGYEITAYLILFIGVFLTGLGSAYYHLVPDDKRLVWDRIPMTIIFMSLVVIILIGRVGTEVGFRAMWILLLLGIGSIVYWRWTSLLGGGDLRPYVLVQFYSPILALLILYFFPGPYPPTRYIVWMVVFYLIAKVFEYFDKAIYQQTGFISGHTLKHLMAATSLYWILVMLHKRNVFLGSSTRT